MDLARIALLDEKQRTVTDDAAVRCVVESPRGSSAKFRYDPELRSFVMGKELIKGLTYPFDWGFFPSTLGADGDPLDVMIIHDSPSASGIIIPSQVIGVLEIEQTEEGGKPERNDRFFAVPVSSHREDSLNDVDQLSKRMREELEQFFQATAALAKRKLEFRGWRGSEVAMKLVDEGGEAFRRSLK